MRFYGTFEHSLDVKGRVILPARMRAPFDGRGVLSEFLDGCLALWTLDAFEKQAARQEEEATRGVRGRFMARVWSAGVHEVEIDRSGRVAIPPFLRAAASLAEGSPVVVIGNLDHVELWSPALWEPRAAEFRQLMREGADA